MNAIVGIDLGTTNSLIGSVVEGKAVLFPDASGQELLPSVVGAGPGGELLVGRAAKNRRLLDASGTVASVKRMMGRNERLRVGAKELSPPEVSALILAALVDRAEAALGARPRGAVVTVPAQFDDAQRQATRDAGEIAGLVIERLVNEPTAASLTYRTGQEELVLVYDLGGGTFDVSVLERDEGLLEVRQSRGDTRLGGDDIDRALTHLVLERLGADRAAVDADPRAMIRLTEAVERAKIALSDREEVRLFDPFVAGEGARAVHLDMALTRADVEVVAAPFLKKTLACIDAALRDAGVRPADLDRVLLVGGASKMPIVRTLVAAHLGRPAQVDLDADRAVALGASLLAGRIMGAEIAEVLVDITPHTLVVGVLGASEDPDDLEAMPVIERGTVVPVERSQMVMTRFDDQPHAMVPIAQGEEPALEDNTYLGEVRVGPLPACPAGSPIEVTFKLDLSGILQVSARHLASGVSAAVTIAESPYGLTASARTASRATVEALRAAPGAEPAAGASEGDLSLARAMLGRARRAMDKAAGASPPDLTRVREAALALEAAMEGGDGSVPDRIDALSDALLDLA